MPKRFGKFTGTLKTVEVIEQQYALQVESLLDKAIKRAGIAWLNATVLASIPVWSGASRATFLKLAQQLSFPLAINPVTNAGLGPAVGFGQSTGALIEQGPGRVVFEYSTTLEHLIYNESNNLNLVGGKLRNPGPYQFQAAGAQAFNLFAQTISLPAPIYHTKDLRIG